MAIDMNGNETYSKEQLKARAMARLSESGLGLAERLANIERIAYGLLDPIGHPLEDPEQVAAIGALLSTIEEAYEKDISDNALLESALAYEAAEARLAAPALTVTDYPDVPDGETGKAVRNPVLVLDDSERAQAQAITDEAPLIVTDTVAARVLAAAQAAE